MCVRGIVCVSFCDSGTVPTVWYGDHVCVLGVLFVSLFVMLELFRQCGVHSEGTVPTVWCSFRR